MCQPSTIPFTPSKAASRPWSPTSREQLIFHWVKFEGHTQAWVAMQLDIDQSTVSRIVDRYQRWIARGGPAYHGSPTHDERLRAQRWLTYERNEWILASALRIAGEMEHATEASRSVIARPMSNPSKESEIRTESKTIDRSAVACRYLRLAHHINMVQKKLIEEEPLPTLEPLTIEDAGAEVCHGHPAEGCHGPARADHADDVSTSNDPANVPYESDSASEPPAMHDVHIQKPAQPSASRELTTTSTESGRSKKSHRRAYPAAASPPEGMDSEIHNPFVQERDSPSSDRACPAHY
jgi:hypothetical protein